MKSANVTSNTLNILAPRGRGCPKGAGEGVSPMACVSPSFVPVQKPYGAGSTGTSSPSRGEVNSGFTLIELLVVVLIIGILAAVAVPQYQKAVKKARLSRYIPLVKSLTQAEEAYYLANGEYSAKMENLDVEFPFEGCKKSGDNESDWYVCEGMEFGVYNLSNAQVQVEGMAYLQYFDDFTSPHSGVAFKKGDIVCYSSDNMTRQICSSLGQGQEEEHNAGRWKYAYFLNR